MNPLVSEFIKKILQPIKYQKIHPQITKEIEDHIESLKENYTEEGLEENKAYQRALEDMGDAEVIGKSFHHIHKPKMEWSILGLMTLLVSVSFIILAIWSKSYAGSGDVFNAHSKQAVFIIMGLGLVSCLYFLDYKVFERWAEIGWCIGILILLWTVFYGININGARRWVRLGPITLSAAYLARVFLILAYTGMVYKWGNRGLRSRMLLGIMALIPVGLTAMDDLFGAVILGSVLFIILVCYIKNDIFKGNKGLWLKILYGTALAGSALFSFILLKDNTHKLQRLMIFMHPETDPNAHGYMYMVLQNLREQASLIGDSGVKMFEGYVNVRDISGDLIFLFIVGKLGWLAGALLISILIFVTLRLFLAASKVQEAYGKIVCISIASLVTIQFIFNILMNLGYTPLTSSYLPFISYGGSAVITDMLLIGVFLSIYRRKDIVPIQCDSKNHKFNLLLEKVWVQHPNHQTLEIAKKLASLKVDTKIIEKATGLTEKEVKNLY
ncbi:MAG: FtsW/RodA/SpoVE family cell cycle protein [Clostridia bacterium]|nr:FtsW/RodA/SpoVE family cell cycle protein [Clostridia bacterium]